MKIIDLLQMIANGEDMPEKIKYNNIDYFWCKQCKIYERFEDVRKVLYNDLENLNDEVEIIEEETEDSEIPNIDFDNMKDIGIKIGKAYRDFYEGLIEGWDNK